MIEELETTIENVGGDNKTLREKYSVLKIKQNEPEKDLKSFTSTALSSSVPKTLQNSDFSKTQLFNSSANRTASPSMSSSMLDKITTSDSSSSKDVEQDLGKVVQYNIETNNNFKLLDDFNYSEFRELI